VRSLFESEGIPTLLRSRLAHSVHPFSIGDQGEVVILVPAHEAARNDEEETAIVAAATGGVVAAKDNLGPLLEHLRAERRGEVRAMLHPMRSGWWALPFALALCAEWAIRRRRGGR